MAPPKYKPSAENCPELFKSLKLHEYQEDFPVDNKQKPFVETARIKEEHNGNGYACVFNYYMSKNDSPILATVGNSFVHVYEVPPNENTFKLYWTVDIAKNTAAEKKNKVSEVLYCASWAYDQVDAANNVNAHKLCVAGSTGHVYVLDLLTSKCDNRLRGIGNEVNDIRTCPSNSMLVATASKDHTIRIHHIRNNCPLVFIGGPKCHTDCVLTVDWHFKGEYLISGGHNHTIMRWDLSSPAIKTHLETAMKVLSDGKRNQLVQHPLTDDEDKFTQQPLSEYRQLVESNFRKEVPEPTDIDVVAQPRTAILDTADRFSATVPGPCYQINVPSGEARDIHTDYVDYLLCFPGTEFILSKSCNDYRKIVFWRFGPPKGQPYNRETGPVMRPETVTTTFQTREIPGAEINYVKFDLDPWKRWIVCGGETGLINVYDMHDRTFVVNKPTLQLSCGHSLPRQCSFSPCGRFLCASDDEGYVFRYDRVKESTDSNILKEFVASY